MSLETLTRTEVAEIYGVKPETISDWASAGKFPKPLPGGNYRWSKKAVEHFMVISSLPNVYYNPDNTHLADLLD